MPSRIARAGLTQALDIAKDYRVKVKDLFWVLVLGGGALFAYDKYKSHKVDQAEILAAAPVAVRPQHAAPASDDRSWIKPRAGEPTASVSGSQFKCDGRTHCSQMRSCAEAEFFIKNCPNTKMDGNNDGEPCEQQWCN